MQQGFELSFNALESHLSHLPQTAANNGCCRPPQPTSVTAHQTMRRAPDRDRAWHGSTRRAAAARPASSVAAAPLRPTTLSERVINLLVRDCVNCPSNHDRSGPLSMPEYTKIRLLVYPPAGNPVRQLGMSYEELRRRSTRRTMMVEPVEPRLFRICEPSLICAFSYGDVIEALPIAHNVWRFSRVFAKSPDRQIFLSPELLCSILYLENRPTYRLIRTLYDAWRHGCSLRHFDDWIVIGCPPDLPFDPMERIRPSAC